MNSLLVQKSNILTFDFRPRLQNLNFNTRASEASEETFKIRDPNSPKFGVQIGEMTTLNVPSEGELTEAELLRKKFFRVF